MLVGDQKSGLYGYIDKTDAMVIAPQFGPGEVAAQSFAEGLAAVRVGDEKTGKWGFISR